MFAALTGQELYWALLLRFFRIVLIAASIASIVSAWRKCFDPRLANRVLLTINSAATAAILVGLVYFSFGVSQQWTAYALGPFLAGQIIHLNLQLARERELRRIAREAIAEHIS
jgi:hypothetical protein